MCCCKWSSLWTSYIILKRVPARGRKSISLNLFTFIPMLIGTFLLNWGWGISRNSLWRRFWDTLCVCVCVCVYIYIYIYVYAHICLCLCSICFVAGDKKLRIGWDVYWWAAVGRFTDGQQLGGLLMGSSWEVYWWAAVGRFTDGQQLGGLLMGSSWEVYWWAAVGRFTDDYVT